MTFIELVEVYLNTIWHWWGYVWILQPDSTLKVDVVKIGHSNIVHSLKVWCYTYSMTWLYCTQNFNGCKLSGVAPYENVVTIDEMSTLQQIVIAIDINEAMSIL